MEDLLLRTLDELTRASTLPDPRRELTAEEVKALESGGFDLSHTERDGVDDPITRTAVLYTALRADSLSVQDAASLLKVNESRVRQLLGSRALYAYRSRKLEASSRASRPLHVVFIADLLLHVESVAG